MSWKVWSAGHTAETQADEDRAAGGHRSLVASARAEVGGVRKREVSA